MKKIFLLITVSLLLISGCKKENNITKSIIEKIKKKDKNITKNIMLERKQKRRIENESF